MEKENLYRQKTGLARRLSETLDGISAGGAPVTAAPPDRETLEKLRALGYLTAPVESRKGEYGEADDPKNLIDVANAADEATELFGEGRIQEAVAIFQDIVRRQPRSSEAHQSLAYALHRTGRAREAVALLESAVRSGLSDTTLLGLLSACLLMSASSKKRWVSWRLWSDAIRTTPRATTTLESPMGASAVSPTPGGRSSASSSWTRARRRHTTISALSHCLEGISTKPSPI
jgi:tetratricopeptide (TPR) repeat protein